MWEHTRSYQRYYEEEGDTQVEEYDAVAGGAQHLDEVVHLHVVVVDHDQVVHVIHLDEVLHVTHQVGHLQNMNVF